MPRARRPRRRREAKPPAASSRHRPGPSGLRQAAAPRGRPPAGYEMHVITNTHWDREWLYDFQETRMLLVDFMDKLLNILDTEPRYRSYLMDSQAVPIEDYLEVRPEKRAAIEKYVKTDRLLIGPWYTCPEEFCVNGESLVRNLLVGHQVAEAYGKVMKIGYSPFSYGQTSQMPQIYAGFGIDSILFYHGVTLEETKSEFLLEGPDGTRLFGSRMGSNARYNFYFSVWRPAIYGMKVTEREYDWTTGGLPFHLCSPERYLGHHFVVDPVKRFNLENLRQALGDLKQAELKHVTTRYLAYMQGMDSTEPDPLEAHLIEEAKKVLAPGDALFHSSMPDWLEKVKREAKNLKVLRGERRVPRFIGAHVHLFGDVVSSRVRTKRANAETEHALQRYAEPWAAAAMTLGVPYPKSFLDLAWKYLLRCHPHDSIAGSGVDQIERDMMNRLDQARHIAGGVMRRAFQQIQARINNSDVEPDTVLLTAFNPSPYPRSEVLTAFVDFDKKHPVNHYDVVDASTGKAVRHQEVSRRDAAPVVRHLADATLEMPAERVELHLDAQDLPALGYRTYRFARREEPLRGPESLLVGERTMENEHLIVRLNDNGTLCVTDKATGRPYDGLHYFEDGGEAGHAWQHIPPAHERLISSLDFPAAIALEEAGPLLARFRVDYLMQIPVDLVEGDGNYVRRLENYGNAASRSEIEKPLRITSWFTVRKGAKSLHVTTRFVNEQRCHRLRVAFPSLIPAAVSAAEVAFDVVEREIERGPDNPWRLTWNPTHPQHRFVDVSDGRFGLAILNRGLREYEVTDTPDRRIYLTLLRAYEIAICTVSWRWERHPEMTLSQQFGEHEVRYAIYPHAGAWERAEVYREAERLNLPVEIAQVGPHGGELPKEMSFLRVEPANLVLSAFKKAERSDALILRLFNPTDKPIAGKVTLPRRIRKARLTNLNEEPEKSLAHTGSSLELTVPKKKIVTVEITV